MRTMIFSACIAATAAAALSARADAWHDDFHLGGADGWRQRIAISVTNNSATDVAGKPVDLRVGGGADEAGLAGANADALRVCDTNGIEMLWGLRAADGTQIRRGPIPAGATLTLPVECGPHSSARLYVYFDNPSAWPVPDFLTASGALVNGDLESGEGGEPAGWAHDKPDETHQTFWLAENPRGGAKCLKTAVAPGAEATWISTRQSNLRIEGGARYVFRAWVRAGDVKGNAGWYLHIGNATNGMLLGPMASGGGGTYDWKEVRAEFTAPADADRASLGTVLRGTGTAWFDDASLERLTAGTLGIHVGRPETALPLRDAAADASWPADASLRFRFPVRLVNTGDAPRDDGLVAVDLTPAIARLNGRADPDEITVMNGGRTVEARRIGNTLLFAGRLEPRTRHTFHLYFRAGGPRKRLASGAVNYAANPAQPGGETTEHAGRAAAAEYARLLASPANLVRNASFEEGDAVPAGWTGVENKPGLLAMAVDTPGLFGNRCARMAVANQAGRAWRGWRQSVPVAAGETYLLAGWVKCEGLSGDTLALHAHCLTAQGAVSRDNGFKSAGPGLSGTQDWTLLQSFMTMPRDAVRFDIHLTTQATGTSWHDGILLARVAQGRIGSLEGRPAGEAAEPRAWPVNAIVKLFRDDPPPVAPRPARLTAARGEREPLQAGFRSPRDLRGVKVTAGEPAGPWLRKLPAPEIGLVGYVPVDHATSYFQSDSPAWHRKFPRRGGQCDGWPGWWPDPILPQDTFDATANQTQPVWLTFRIPRDAKPGDYRGKVRFATADRTVAELPYTMRVWDFALPEETHVKAIYDARMRGPAWRQEGVTDQEMLEELWRFMAERRLCPDTVKPEPKLAYRDGKVVADFAEFDRAASYYFDTLKLTHMYTPHTFYCFGWGHPPGKKFGEAPYAGDYPYTNVDRSVLSPGFKHAYQACLKVFWDHLKEKGWDKKCVLYISDEPYDRLEPIRKQMIALCAMIHEVDPAIRIYCSTWHHQPEWDGALDVWGIGHDGRVPVEKIAEIQKGGATIWWTTDGQMCTDTPYCGVERLLPHWCFTYGAEAYEFWGIDWLTYDPYEFGWHAYIHQSGQPGDSHWVRYPNGDGYLVYPGTKFGRRTPVPSVRVEQAGEGCEDYEYLWLLQTRIEAAKQAGRDTAAAQATLVRAQELVTIPNAGGRYSTRFLPDPDEVFRVKEDLARAIESLN